MQRLRRAVKTPPLLLLFAVVVGAAISACTSGKSSAPPVALPAVSPLPSLKPAAWIKEINPRGQADTLAQIRVIFNNPLIPLQAIETPAEQNFLAYFVIDPQLPGRFRFLTPRMVGFEQDEALPLATRVRITVKAGLKDLAGHQLPHELAWTFTTAPLKFTDLPGFDSDGNRNDHENPSGLRPTLRFRSNTQLDLESLRAHTSLRAAGSTARVGLIIDEAKGASPPPGSEDQPQYQYDASTRTWEYTVTPASDLGKGESYELRFEPGVQPARGNLPSDRAFTGYVTTFSPLAFKKIAYSGVDRFAAGLAQLQFNNPLSADSVKANLRIAPQPQSTANLFHAEDGDNSIAVNPAWLTPQTKYTITISGGLTDKFGQAFGQTRSVVYDTGDFTPNFWAPDGFNIFPSDNDLQLDISAVNVPHNQYLASYRAIAPEELVYYDSAYPNPDGSGLLRDAKFWSPSFVTAAQNQVATITVPVRSKLGGNAGTLAYGLLATTNRYPQDPVQRYFGLLQLTNLGVFAQWFPSSGVIRVEHLSDGSVAKNATVAVYISKLGSTSRQSPTACVAGTTDAGGSWWLSDTEMRRCSVDASPGRPPMLLVIAREQKDWAFVRTDDWSGAYGYGLYAGWQAQVPESRGTIFSDRQLYQPGEGADFTAVAYFLRNGSLLQDRNHRYHIALAGPNGEKSDLGYQTSNDYGSFSFHVQFKTNQPLGYYNITAKASNGYELSGGVQVAEFKPPNFKVDLNLDKDMAFPDDTVNAKGVSTYLFGSPLQKANAQYFVTREQTYFTPKGREEYSFGRQWFWPDTPPSVPSDVLQLKGTLDDAGTLGQAVKVAHALPYPMAYRVDLQVTDVSNLSVADSKTFTALPSDALIGLKGDWVAAAGKPAAFAVIVTDDKGVAIKGRRVRLQLDLMQYSSAAQIVASGETEQNQVRYKTVATTEVESGGDAVAATLTPPQAGPYRVRANFSNAADDSSATDLALWSTGPGEVDWGAQDRDHLQVKLDKTTYHPGDMATALIQSPYPRANLYFAVVRDRTLYHSISDVSGSAPEVRFRVTRDMVPNAAVEAVLVRRGPPLKQLQPGSLDSLARIGFAPFSLNVDDKYLNVTISSAHAALQPGTQQTVRLHLSDVQRKAVRGEFAVMVANEAVLQLTGYRPPDLVKVVYAEQPISTRFSDNRPAVVLQQIASPLQKGWGYGGGFMPGAAGTRIRRNFKPLAYFNGALLSDDNGDARFSFTVPDDLTTWRIMAVAIGHTASATSADMRFGNSDATFVTTKDLLTNPILPQFARPGDKLDAGLIVTNTSGLQGALNILASLNGPLVFQTASGGEPQSQRLSETVQPGTVAYRLPMLAKASGRAEVTFSSRLGDKNDAFAVPLQIQAPLSIMEQVVETGVTTNAVSIPLTIDARSANDSGGLQLSLASTLLPELTVPAMYTIQKDDLLILEPIASRLIIAADLKILGERYARSLGDFDPSTFGLATLQQLRQLQTSDGGFVWFGGWRHSSEDVFVAPYGAQALAAAQRSGLPVDSAMLARAKSYLEAKLHDPGVCDTFALCRARLRLDVLLALSDLGETRNDFLSDIYDQHEQFDLLGQVELARYLLRFPSWRSQAGALADKLRQNIYETGRYATINYPEQWGWLESPAAMRAQVLRLFIARGADAEWLDRLTASLLALRRDGTWRDTYDTAEALGALIEYAQLQPQPPHFSATATLAGRQLEALSFEGFKKTSTDLQVGMSSLPRGTNTLALQKTGSGSLHYVAALRYRLTGNRPGVLAGLRVTRQVRVANDAKVIAKMGLNAPNDPLTVQPAQVFDIGLEIITDHPVDHVVITDELPAGFEAVDTTFRTATQYFQPADTSWEIGYQMIHKDRISAYATRLEAGVYSMHYLVRAVTPGTYLWPPAQVHLQFAPEEFGRSSSSTLIIAAK